MTAFNIILFDGFETLDAMGPIEIISKLPSLYKLEYFSLNGGMVESSQSFYIKTQPLSEINPNGYLLIPGGMGTRKLIEDTVFISAIKTLVEQAPYVLTVCTGVALLGKTGLLEGKRATGNKMAFEWIEKSSSAIWIKKARWVNDGKFYSSSGVSAGMDMMLGFIRDIHSVKMTQNICKYIEYIWNDDADNDPFAII
ncbi:MAG: DJ-1/PfpI family protein [Ruminiclostridium sp.]|nr:DJ-1/PfpI family protein [Ruminiclostridium sp.]